MPSKSAVLSTSNTAENEFSIRQTSNKALIVNCLKIHYSSFIIHHFQRMFFQIINILHIFFVTLTIGWAIKQVLEHFNITPSLSRPSLDWLCLWGFVGLVVVLQIAHLFVPINGVFQAVLSVFCLIIALFSYKSFKNAGCLTQSSNFSLFTFHFSLPIIILFVFALLESVGASKINDTFLYHHGAIRWINDFPIVKGLANLHNRYGFNSTMFLASTFFSGRWWAGGDLLPSINIFFFLLMILRGSSEIQKAWKKEQFFIIFFHLAFIFIIFFQLKAFFSGVSPDLISAVLVYFLITAFSKMADTSHQQLNFIHLVFLVFLLPTLKLSQATCASALIFIGFYYPWYKDKRAWVLVGATGFALIVPWLYRTILLTGYPLFPSTTFDFFAVDWKVPATSPSDSTFVSHSALSAKAFVQSWARIPEGHFSKTLAMPCAQWLPIWGRNQSFFTNALIGLAFVSPFAILVLFYLKKLEKRIFLLWISVFLNVIFWFFSAPDFRFAAASIMFCSLFCLLPLFVFLSKPISKKLILTTATAFFLYIFYVELVKKSTRITPSELSKVIIYPTKYPQPILIKKSANGCDYYVPDVDNSCGDAPFPCSPYENERLILRGPHLSDGFSVTELKIKN